MAITRDTSAPAVQDGEGIKVIRACTIRSPAARLYAFWRDLEKLPLVMPHLELVRETSATGSHWVAKVAGKKIEWDADIINETPNRLIAWKTREGVTPAHAGSIRFEDAPGDRGTEVTVALEYDPPGGKAASLIAKLFGKDPADQVANGLRRFKALMETGVIPSTEGQPVGGKQKEKQKKSKEV